MGRDNSLFTLMRYFSIFQSTRPAWGATARESRRDIQGAISIHAPRMGRDGRRALMWHVIVLFQSTRPAWGATKNTDDIINTNENFNPRAPHGARLVEHRRDRHVLRDFNPRAPHGARPRRAGSYAVVVGFQSTRPAWGATGLRPETRRNLGISIHAPRMGRDARIKHCVLVCRYFNPRAPHGARRRP